MTLVLPQIDLKPIIKEGRKVLFLNSHGLGNFQRCKKHYLFANIESIVPKRDKRIGIMKGTLWHGIHKIWNEGERLGADAFKTHKKCIEWFNENCPEEIDVQTKLLILRRFAEYRQKYPSVPGTILGIEKGFSKKLYEDAYITVIYEGKIDLLVKTPQGILTWVDYKTQHPAFTRDLYPYNNQFMGYTWAVGNNHGIVDYTTYSTTITDRTFRRQLYSYDSRRIARWKELTIQWALEMVRTYITGNFIENYNGCDSKYGICQYTPICEIEPSFRDRVKSQDFVEIEPYRSW